MGNCFSGDDTTPENSVHRPPPEDDAAVLGGDHRTWTARSSPSKRRKELFSEVGLHHKDEILEVILKEKERIGQPGFQLILKSSHSAGAVVDRGVDLSDGERKLQRFKVKTLDVGDFLPPDGQAGGTGGGKGGGGK